MKVKKLTKKQKIEKLAYDRLALNLGKMILNYTGFDRHLFPEIFQPPTPFMTSLGICKPDKKKHLRR